jgi:hypothetical protein
MLYNIIFDTKISDNNEEHKKVEDIEDAKNLN